MARIQTVLLKVVTAPNLAGEIPKNGPNIRDQRPMVGGKRLAELRRASVVLIGCRNRSITKTKMGENGIRTSSADLIFSNTNDRS